MKVRIKGLKDAAQKAIDDQTAILAAVDKSADKTMTAEQKAAFDAATVAYDVAMADIVPLQAMVERAARVAAVTIPADPIGADVTGVLDDITRAANAPALATPVAAIPKGPDEWKTKIGCYAWAAARAKQYPRNTPLEHLETFGLKMLADESRAADAAMVKDLIGTLGAGNPIVVRTLTTLSGAGGDNMITTPLGTEFIEFLRATSAFMRGGPREVPMPLGSLSISGGNAGAAGTYHAENADIGYTQATTRKVNLQAKHIGAVTSFGNYLLDTSPLAVASIFGDDLVNGIAQGMDLAGLRGDGTGDNPTGILSLTSGTHVYAAVNATAPTLAQIDADIKGMLTKLDQSLVPKLRRKFVMASRTFRYLQFMRDGNGNIVFPGLHMPTPVWYDNVEVIVSDLLPYALGAGTNESELYLCDFAHVLMGITRALRLKASTEASYKNAGGTLVSAFSKDETVVRGMASHDFDMRHTKAAVILNALKWGA